MFTCVLLGTPAFAFPIASMLQRLPGCALRGIITKPDEPAGRGRKVANPPLVTWAKEHGVAYWQPATKADLTAVIRNLQPDVAIVVAYGKIIPPDALMIPRFGFVNIHPSLLPKYRGPSPVHTVIANGDTETGVTLMILDADVDHGPILAQERIAIPSGGARQALEEQLARIGAQLLTRVLPDYIAGEIQPQEQNHAFATFTKLLTREDGRLNWNEPADVLERKIRAYEGWPGTWCRLPSEKRLKVLSGTIGASTIETPGGIIDGDQFRVACGGGTSLILSRVQLEGSAPMDGPAFLRGYHGPKRLSSNA